MNLIQQIESFTPTTEQEAVDKEVMLRYISDHPDCLERTNLTGHFTASAWTVNKERTKMLMIYHKLYDSWSWIGGHADGEEDLCAVAMRELQEETGIANARLVSRDIFSLEVLVVNGHEKKGKYVPGHLHLNVTFLVEAEEEETLIVNEAETRGVSWFSFEDALKASKEPWFVERVYTKLVRRCLSAPNTYSGFGNN